MYYVTSHLDQVSVLLLRCLEANARAFRALELYYSLPKSQALNKELKVVNFVLEGAIIGSQVWH
jgi:hypothetical protein